MAAPHPPGDRLSLEEARALASARQWPVLVQRADALPREELFQEPELAFHYADGLWRVGRGAEALRLAARLEDSRLLNGNRWLRLNLINVIGIALFEMSRSAEAEERFSELLEYATEWGDDEFAARASNNLGVLSNIRGARESALTYYQRALASYQRLGYLRGLAQTHYNLGISYRDLDRAAEADAHYRRAMEYAEASGSEDVVALAENERAVLYVRTGDGKLAERLARRALQRFVALGDPVRQGEALRVLASAAVANGNGETAREFLQEALEIARVHTSLLLQAEVQRDRGSLLRDVGDPAGARTAWDDAAGCFARLGALEEAASVRERIAELDASHNGAHAGPSG